MLRFEVKTASAVSPAEIAAWAEVLAESSLAPSPYQTPDFFLAVARVRASARVLIGYQSGAPVLFFPFHRGGATGLLGLGHVIGGPVCDVHGVIARPGLAVEPEVLMAAARLNLLSLKHVPAADPVFRRLAQAGQPRHACHLMDLSHGFAVYEQERAPFAKSAFKAIRTRLAKAEALHGTVGLEFWDQSPGSFAALQTWKRQQFTATGQINVLDVPWVAALVRDLMARKTGLRAQVSSLSFGGRLVAVHLGLRTDTALHYWFPAYDPAVQEFSPGNLLLYRMAQSAAAEGVRQINLGAGDYRYKIEFANCSLPMVSGMVLGAAWPATLAKSGQRLIGALEQHLPSGLSPLPAGAVRRLDRHLSFKAL